MSVDCDVDTTLTQWVAGRRQDGDQIVDRSCLRKVPTNTDCGSRITLRLFIHSSSNTSSNTH